MRDIHTCNLYMRGTSQQNVTGTLCGDISTEKLIQCLVQKFSTEFKHLRILKPQASKGVGCCDFFPQNVHQDVKPESL